MKQSCTEVVCKAQKGDRNAREYLLQNSTNFILKTAARSCRRFLDQKNDDEFSIAMIAFNEAIDTYDDTQSSGFYSYARLVIQRRLIDHFRKEKKHITVSLEVEEKSYLEYRTSLNEYLKEQEASERKHEIAILAGELQKYGVSFELLERKSPKHKDTRENLFKVACALIKNPFLYKYFEEKKRLPQKELSRETGFSIKFLERGRAYIISMALILKHPELVYMRSYISAPDLE